MKNELYVTSGADMTIPPEVIPCAIDAVKVVIDTIKEITISAEVERTKREYLRQNALVAIAQIESDTSKYLQTIKNNHEQKMKVIDIFAKYMERSNASPEMMEMWIKMMKEIGVGQYGGNNGR